MKQQKQPEHYVNNKEFSVAIIDYCRSVDNAVKNGNPIPKVTNYIAESFMKIAEGLSHRSNFIRYTYREEMVMDAVENCLRAIHNYDAEVATRTGSANPFSYFTQICFYAFLRRIEKEKKQHEIKYRFIDKFGIEEFMSMGMDGESAQQSQMYIDQLKQKIDQIRERDSKIKEFAKDEKTATKTQIELFME